MRQVLVNHALSLAKRHEVPQAAILAKGDNGICFVHFMLMRDDIGQDVHAFKSKDELKLFTTDEALKASTMILGYYSVSVEVWNLVNLVNVYEIQLSALKHIPASMLKGSFSEQLIDRLLIASKIVTDVYADLPEGQELWKLCISGTNQDIYVPSDTTSGLALMPGEVLANLSAPKGMPSSVASMLRKEKEIVDIQTEEKEKLMENYGSFMSTLLKTMGLDIEHDHPDEGFGLP